MDIMDWTLLLYKLTFNIMNLAHNSKLKKIDKRKRTPVAQEFFNMEPRGIEPLTSSLPAMRSPS
jgi:hypothetical protein